MAVVNGSEVLATDTPDHSWLGRGRTAWRDNAPDVSGMGIGGRALQLVFRPLSFRTVGLVRQRRGRPVFGFHPAGWDHLSLFSCRCRPGLERAGHWHVLGLLRPQGTFRSHRVCVAARLLGLLATAACRRTQSDPHSADLDPCLHRLVGLSDRVTSSTTSWVSAHDIIGSVPPLCICVRDRHSRCSTWSRSQRTLRCSLFSRRSASCSLARNIHNDVTDPAMGFLAPAMYWYGWAATAALGALMSESLPWLCPKD